MASSHLLSASPSWPLSLRFRPVLLQRKCACGAALGDGGQCRSCGAKQNNGYYIPYNFGEIRVHAEAPGREAESGFPVRLAETVSGDTSCDLSTGVPVVTLHEPSPCYKDCTARHEEVHRKDLTPCCKRGSVAWNSAKDEKEKSTVENKMEEWGKTNEPLLQCRAYAESVKCADEFIAAHCGAKKADTGESGSSPLSADEMQGSEISDLPRNAVPPVEDRDTSAPNVLAEDKPGAVKQGDDKPGDDKPVEKSIDRAAVTPLRTIDGTPTLRGQAWCKTAKKESDTVPVLTLE